MSVIKNIFKGGGERPGSRGALRVFILALLILVCMGMTYYAHFILHAGIVFSHFFYVPIVLAGLWWGRRAVWVGVFLGTWLMAIHLFSGSEILLAPNLLRFVMFVVVGIVVGAIREQALKLEEATKLAYSELNQIFNAAADAMLVIDKDFNVLQANETFSLLFGISKDEVTGRKCYEVFRGPRCETPDCALKRILDGEERLEYDTERESKDGARITCIGTIVPLRKADGDLIGIVEDFKDITDRNQLYAELEAAKTYTESIIQNFLDTLIVTDMEAKIITVNPATCDLLGYTEEELIGQPVSIIFAEEEEEEVRQFFRFFRDPRNKEALNMQGTIRNRQFTYKTKSGQLIPMSFNDSIMKDEAGNVTGVVAGAKDLTEIKQAEKELKESEEEYRSLVESTEDSVYLVDRDCRYLFINNKHLSRLGLAKDQAIGRTYNELHSKEETEEFAKVVEEIFETGNSIQHEHRSHRSNRYYLRTLSPVKDSKGGISAVTVVSKDITERKQAEEKIKYIGFHDALTGLYNRTYFEEEMRRVNTKRNYPITIIISDINGLKLVNDTLGHAQGDELLKNTAKVLKSVSRNGDIMARIGGDEFAIILPHCDENVAQAFCNRFRDACKICNIELKCSCSIALGYAVQRGQYKDMDSVLKQADENMYTEKLSDTASRERHIIDTLRTVLSTRDPHTEKHAGRLQNLAEVLGKSIGLSELKLGRLRLLALLHDIGKIGTPDNILFKPDKLTEEEWEIMKKHAEEGYKMAQNIPQLVFIAEDILHHHERWDGTGYPKGLKGEEIPILSRIISIVDAYDVMLTERPYKKAMTEEEAIQELKENAGTQFDPELVKKFIFHLL